MINMMVYSFLMLYSFILMFFMSLFMYYMEVSVLIEWLVFSMNSFVMEFIILMDWVAILFVSFVLLISSKVMLYSVNYMNNDKLIMRYVYLMLLFIMSMIIMIISPNIFSIMFGWDGLGLVSFCLVIYYQNYMSYNSGMITVLCNRVGDIGILMSISLMMVYGSWSSVMVSSGDMLNLMMLLLAMITKSAQIPFSTWLPLAMAAPTPISALVHSSTLVTAGIYLMIRFNNLYMESGANLIVLYLAVMTMFMSGIMASVENDLKKVIALSTLSQLGLMMMILSVGEGMLAFYHLLIHAVFKSLMFLCAGVIIHLMMNNQDIRLLGGIYESVPMVIMMLLVSNLALCGFPFMAGFYSKDFIMEVIYTMKLNIYMLVAIVLSLMFTVVYTVRLVYYMFWSDIKFYSFMSIKEDSYMNKCMIILMSMSVFVGSVINWLFFFDYYIMYLSMSMKMLTLMVCLSGICVGVMIVKYLMLKKFYYMIYYLSSMWFLNYVYMWIYGPLNIVSIKIDEVDKVWVEYTFKGWINLMISYINLKNFFSIYMFMGVYIMYVYIQYLFY